jgi:hypothetical protein
MYVCMCEREGVIVISSIYKKINDRESNKTVK